MDARTIALGLIALCATATLTATDAAACLCPPTEHGFLVPSGVVLPANARGVPWAGWRAGSPGRPQAPDSARFLIERRDGGSWRPVALEVVPVDDALAGTLRNPRGEDVVLLRPRDGFRSGARYRFTFFRIPGDPARRPPRTAPGDPQVVLVEVSARAFVVGDRSARARVTPVRLANVVAATSGGSCATTFLGASSSIRLVLPSSLAEWGDALLYVVRDESGRVWRPDSSLCEWTAPGRNALGPGHERLFAYCGAPAGSGQEVNSWYDQPDETLPARRQRLEITAWLPGTAEHISAQAVVDLSCAAAGP